MGAAIPYWTTDAGRWIGFAVLVVFTAVIVLIWGPEDLRRAPEDSQDLVPAES